MIGIVEHVVGRARRGVGELLFERLFGVRTGGRVSLEELGLGHEERVYYIASRRRTLRRTLGHADIGPDDVFLDLGSGMGRMVLEAARLPFKRVIGVELSAELHHIARTNVSRNRRRPKCSDVVLVNSDVLDYDIPDDVTVIYMFNPFRGAIFAGVVDRMLASLERRPRHLRVIYANPVEAHQLLAGGFEVRKTIHLSRGADDGSIADSVQIYAN